MSGDTVFAWHNNLIYSRYVSKLNREDFFSREEELAFTKGELIKILEKDDLYSVDRDYGTSQGFDRVR